MWHTVQDDMKTSVTSSENLQWLKDSRTQDIPSGGVSCAGGVVLFGRGALEGAGEGTGSKVGRTDVVGEMETTSELAKAEQSVCPVLCLG